MKTENQIKCYQNQSEQASSTQGGWRVGDGGIHGCIFHIIEDLFCTVSSLLKMTREGRKVQAFQSILVGL